MLRIASANSISSSTNSSRSPSNSSFISYSRPSLADRDTLKHSNSLHNTRRFDPTNIQKRVLEWCQNQTYGYKNVKITNFSSSWSDGLAFCALIHSFMPDSFDYDSLNPTNRRQNFELAFETAQERANIMPLLEVNDMIAMGNKPDDKCVYTYISTIYSRFQKLRPRIYEPKRNDHLLEQPIQQQQQQQQKCQEQLFKNEKIATISSSCNPFSTAT